MRYLAFAVLVVAAGFVAAGCGGGRRAADGAGPASTSSGATAGDDWVVLGQRRVTFAVDHDEIPVTVLRGDFKRIRIEVENSSIHMIDCKVHFGNGQVQDIPLREEFRPGTASRIIDLVGTDRVIRRISFRYRTDGRPRNGWAVVRVHGRH